MSRGTKSSERVLDEVELFLHQVKAERPEKQRQKIHMLHEKEFVLNEKNPLLVDDDVRNTFALSRVFEEKGMSVLLARSVQEALDRLEIEKMSNDNFRRQSD